MAKRCRGLKAKVHGKIVRTGVEAPHSTVAHTVVTHVLALGTALHAVANHGHGILDGGGCMG